MSVNFKADFRDESKVLDNANFDKIIYLRCPRFANNKGNGNKGFRRNDFLISWVDKRQ